jgi:hypothetical protein
VSRENTIRAIWDRLPLETTEGLTLRLDAIDGYFDHARVCSDAGATGFEIASKRPLVEVKRDLEAAIRSARAQLAERKKDLEIEAVALDVLLEHFSPEMPFRYEWRTHVFWASSLPANVPTVIGTIKLVDVEQHGQLARTKPVIVERGLGPEAWREGVESAFRVAMRLMIKATADTAARLFTNHVWIGESGEGLGPWSHEVLVMRDFLEAMPYEYRAEWRKERDIRAVAHNPARVSFLGHELTACNPREYFHQADVERDFGGASQMYRDALEIFRANQPDVMTASDLEQLYGRVSQPTNEP